LEAGHHQAISSEQVSRLDTEGRIRRASAAASCAMLLEYTGNVIEMVLQRQLQTVGRDFPTGCEQCADHLNIVAAAAVEMSGTINCRAPGSAAMLVADTLFGSAGQ